MIVVEISGEEQEFLKPYVEEWSELAAIKLERTDIRKYLDALDDMILCYGFDKKMEFYNEIGEGAQLIYDRVLDACDDYDDRDSEGE